MDFFGRLAGERNVDVEFRRYRILLLDTRCRRSGSEAIEVAKEQGILRDDDGISARHTPRGLLTSLMPSDDLHKISGAYLNFKPKYIPLLNSNQCDQRRTSYRTWLAVKIYHYMTANYTPVSKTCSSDTLIESVRDSISVAVRKNFIELSNINLNTHTCDQFSLPLFLNKPKTDRDIQVWLAKMSRWRYAIKDLHPILCKSTGASDYFQMRDNLPSILDRCDVCRSIISEDKAKSLELADNREDVFEKRKMFGAVDNSFVQFMITIAALLAHNAIAYLIALKYGGNEGETFIQLLESTQKALQDIENNVKQLYKRKRKMKQIMEYSIVGSLIEAMSHVSKGYARRKFYIVSESGDRKDLIFQTLFRVQNFICCYMDEFSYHCVNLFYSRFHITTRKALLLEIIKSYNLFITWSSMNKLLENNYTDQKFHPKPLPKSAEIRSAFRLARIEVLHDILPIVYDTMKNCDIHLFRSRLETSSVNLIELSSVCNDFPSFIHVLPNVSRQCHHSLKDLYGLTGGKLKMFMRETDACYEANRHLIDSIIQDAKDHMTYGIGRAQERNFDKHE